MEKQTVLRMKQETHTAIKAEAARQDRSMNWIINDAIRRYIEENNKDEEGSKKD